MENEHSPHLLADDELLRRLSDLLRQSRRNEADLIAHLAEVDERRLYSRMAAPSLFAYCTEVLHFSEPEAYLRITAARASRQHPVLLAMLADGRLHLSGVAKLAPHLTVENREAVLARATHLSKRQIEELVAELAPRPDVPDRIRRLSALNQARSSEALFPEAGTSGWQSDANAAGAGSELRPDGVDIPPASQADRYDAGLEPAAGAGRASTRPASVEPIAAGRYKVQFTASAELREKLERLRELMRSPQGDVCLAAVIEAAVDEKLKRLEARRVARTAKPRKTVAESDTHARSRHIPAAVRRAVWERDGGRCRFVGEKGRRCTARRGLEFHHRHPYGFGGDHSVENLQLACRTHNRYLAEIDYGNRPPRRHPTRPRPQPAASP
jgi:5-methylcytosine-specific restriction endonuclease McrA